VQNIKDKREGERGGKKKRGGKVSGKKRGGGETKRGGEIHEVLVKKKNKRRKKKTSKRYKGGTVEGVRTRGLPSNVRSPPKEKARRKGKEKKGRTRWGTVLAWVKGRRGGRRWDHEERGKHP